MLKELNRDQGRFVAMLARTARVQRDAFIGRVPEDNKSAPCAKLRNPRQCGHRFRRKAATQSDRKRPPDPNEGGHPVDGVIRGALSAV